MSEQKLPIFAQEACSALFYQAFMQSGSQVIDCEACGRTHFGSTGDFEEGEYKELERKQEQNPDKYISHVGDSIAWAHIFGKQVVFDCPCNYTRRLENILWAHKFEIAQYLAARVKDEVEEAKKTSDLIAPGLNEVLAS